MTHIKGELLNHTNLYSAGEEWCDSCMVKNNIYPAYILSWNVDDISI